VLETMLRGLGVELARVQRPFEPESGAYTHSHADATPAARIHAFGSP
jgi:urease accessory protein UreE